MLQQAVNTVHLDAVHTPRDFQESQACHARSPFLGALGVLGVHGSRQQRKKSWGRVPYRKKCFYDLQIPRRDHKNCFALRLDAWHEGAWRVRNPMYAHCLWHRIAVAEADSFVL